MQIIGFVAQSSTARLKFACFNLCIHLYVGMRQRRSSIHLTLIHWSTRYADSRANSCFVGAENELRRAYACILNDKALVRFATRNNFTWHFNPPHASHMGGACKTMLRIVRKVLLGVCVDRPLSDESFETLLTEIEAIINGRPLTKLSDDPDDPAHLTPNHLLIGSNGPVWLLGSLMMPIRSVEDGN